MGSTSLSKWLRRDKVSSLRLREVCRVSPRDTVAEGVRAMADCHTGFVLVMEGADGASRLVGIFTERDFVNRVDPAGAGGGVSGRAGGGAARGRGLVSEISNPRFQISNLTFGVPWRTARREPAAA